MSGPTQPYPGLRPFERDEDAIFFGREEQTDQLLKKLGETRFVAVLGTYGSGKSSLVRAGVLPALEGGFLTVAGADWEIATLRPGERPIETLAEALVRDTAWGKEYVGGAPSPRSSEAPDRREGAPPTDSGIASLAADLRRGPMALNWLLGVRPLGSDARLLILVDQFEELFRFRHDESGEADAFVALLLAAAEHPSVYLVITMRSDFLGDCARHPGLPEAVNAGLYLTPRLDPEQMADAIRLPARVFGGEVEPALVKRLLSEAGGERDQLPLLQHALMRLWDLDDGDKRLTLRDFERLGGLPQAMNDHAEEAYGDLDEAQRGVAEVLAERGPDRRDTRRPTRLGDVAALADATPERIATVADVFRGPGRSFLMPPPDVPLDPDTVLDITHEALIRQWRRLKDWTLAEAEQGELYRRLEGDWRRNRERETTSLWRGYELSLVRPWLEDPERPRRWAARYSTGDKQAAASSLTLLAESARVADEAEVAEASERRHKLRAARRTAALTLLGLLAALGLALWAWYERDHSLDAEREADEHARRAEKAAVRATSARNAAENLIRFITFDLRTKLEPLGKLELLRDAQQRVDAYYELLGVLDDNLAVMRTRAVNLINSGDLQRAFGDLVAAERLYGEGTEILRRLAEVEPDNLDRRRDLSVSLNKVGDIKAAQGDLAGALSAYEEGKAIAERLAAADPSNTEWQRDMVVSLWKLSGDGLAAPEAVRGYLQRALEILEGLKAAGKLHGEHRDWPDSVRQRLEGIDLPPN